MSDSVVAHHPASPAPRRLARVAIQEIIGACRPARRNDKRAGTGSTVGIGAGPRPGRGETLKCCRRGPTAIPPGVASSWAPPQQVGPGPPTVPGVCVTSGRRPSYGEGATQTGQQHDHRAVGARIGTDADPVHYRRLSEHLGQTPVYLNDQFDSSSIGGTSSIAGTPQLRHGGTLRAALSAAGARAQLQTASAWPTMAASLPGGCPRIC